MIFGTGTDIIEVSRIKKAIVRTQAFTDKIFTSNEQAYCEAQKSGKFQSYAARYAAKEAFFKALGTGYRDGMAFREIEVVNDKLGKPEIVVHGSVKDFVLKNRISHLHLSLSHIRETAVAFVIIEKE
jgi:holo-[acyl-carrier protein] synthase